MANIKFSGFTEYETLLRNLEKSTEGIAKRGVYEGAKVVADAVKAQISFPVKNTMKRAMPTANNVHPAKRGNCVLSA